MASALRIGILISGRGSNMAAILREIREGVLRGRVECRVVISDKADAAGLAIAGDFGVPAHFVDPGPFRTRMSEEAENSLVRLLREAGVELVVLAGYMRVIKAPLLGAYPDRIVNIHPSLLPKFPGLDVQRRALEAGETRSGCTVHLVNAEIDSGAILARAEVPILPGDGVAELSARILVEEHRIFPEVLRRIAVGEIVLPPRPNG